jgi:RHS repeat-associated protein
MRTSRVLGIIVAGTLVATDITVMATTASAGGGGRSGQVRPVKLTSNLLEPMGSPRRDEGTYIPLPTATTGENLTSDDRRRQRPASPPSVEPTTISTAPEGWTPDSHWKRNADGSITREQYFGPQFRRANGGWEPIDPALTAGAEAGTAAESRTSLKPVKFGARADRLVRLSLDGGTVTLSAPDLAVRAPDRHHTEVRYADVARDTDLVLRNTPAGVVKELHLRSAAAPRSFHFHLADPSGVLGAATAASGGIAFSKEVEAQTTLTIPAPFAYESRAAVGDAAPVNLASAHLSFRPAGDGWDIDLSVDEKWLEGKTFPITLDPSLIYNGTASDGYVHKDRWNCDGTGFLNGEACAPNMGSTSAGAGTATNGSTGPEMRPRRMVWKFSTSSIDPFARIDSATIKTSFAGCIMYTTNYCDTNTYHAQLARYNGAWSSTTAWGAMPGYTVTEAEKTINPWTTTPSPVTFSIQNMVQDWVGEGGVRTTNNGLVLKLREEPATSSIGGPSLYTANYSDTTKRPYISITYSPRPDPPASVTLSKLSNTSLKATWVAPPDYGTPIDSYTATLYRDGAVYGSYTCPSCLAKTWSGLPPGEYYVKVHGSNTIGPGEDRQSAMQWLIGTPEVTRYVLWGSSDPVVRGDMPSWKVVVSNPSGEPMDVSALTDTFESGYDITGMVPLDLGPGTSGPGTPCIALCAVSGNTLSIGAFTIAPKSLRTFYINAIATGDERGCTAGSIVTKATNVFGTRTTTSTSTICHGGLGIENWWQYEDRNAGAGHTARLNPANGNLVVQTIDSTPVQARGRHAFVVRRTYNSQLKNGNATPPGYMGAGWLLNVGHSDELAADGVAPTGMIVGAAQDGLNKMPVTLVDRDGTRHIFTPKKTDIAIDVAAISPAQTHLAVLKPLVVKVPTAYASTDRICIDATYQAPPGVHLSLWRYVTVNTNGAPGCTAATGTTPKALGWVTVRPDRMRHEFSATGHQLSAVDGSGVELRYVYEAEPTPGVIWIGRPLYVYEPQSCQPRAEWTTTDFAGRPVPPSWCRALRFEHRYQTDGWETVLTDPAGRKTRYKFDDNSSNPNSRLLEVVHPDNTSVKYSYALSTLNGEACGVTVDDELCSITDTLSHTTRFAYSAAPLGLPRISRMTDRNGTPTFVGYSSPGTTPEYVTVDRGSQRIRFQGIDTSGRVSEVLEGSTADNYVRQTHMRWDTEGCRKPDQAADNNLCTLIRRKSVGATLTAASAAAAGDEETTYRYNSEGDVLRVRRVNNGEDIINLDHTFGYDVNAYSTDLAPTSYTDRVTGGGEVTSTPATGARSGPDTLYVTSDRVESLPPRGNVAMDVHEPGRTWESFRTTYTVANNTTAGINATSTGACTSRNSGLICQVTGAAGDHTGAQRTTVSYEYDSFGQRTTMRTALAHERNAAAEAVVRYRYFESTADRDSSNYVTTVGWLRAIEDESGRAATATEPAVSPGFVAFDYDRAGNTIRTWDRNATRGKAYTAFPRTSAGALQPGYAENRYSLWEDWEANPGPYLNASVDALGNKTDYVVDSEGNVTHVYSPRASLTNGGGDFTKAVFMQYDANGNRVAVHLPGNPFDKFITHYYDARDNLVSTQDPNGGFTFYEYDNADRRTGIGAVRGAWPTDPAKQCTKTSSSTHWPLPANQNLCLEKIEINGVDNVTRTYDRNGQYTDITYDSVHQRVSVSIPRNHGGRTFVRTDYDYDANGNVLRVCPPREFDGKPATRTCTPDPDDPNDPNDPVDLRVYSTHHTYDALDRTTRTRRYRSGAEPLDVLYTYDNAHNVTRVTDPNGHVTTFDYDILGRRTHQRTPRSDTLSGTTEWRYDAVGNPVTTLAPAPAGTNRITLYRYDGANRLFETIRGASSTDPSAVGVTSADGGSNVRTRVVYDKDGNVVAEYGPRAFTQSVTDPDERFAVRRDYDDAGRLKKVYTPRYDEEYDSGFDLSVQSSECPYGSTPDPAPGVDPWPASETDHVGVCVNSYAYDLAGNLQHVDTIDPEDRITYTYTADGLLASVVGPRPDGTSGALATYEHDKAGQVVSVTDAGQHQQVTDYTPDGLVKTVTASASGTLTHTTRFDYDAEGNRTQLIQPVTVDAAAGRVDLVTTTTYGSDGLVTTIDAPGSTSTARNLTTFTYDKAGNPLTVGSPSANDGVDATNPNDAVVVNTYTHDNLLASTIQPVSNDGTSKLRRISYTYDEGGRRTVTRTDNVSRSTGSNGQVTYQALDAGTEQQLEYYANDLIRLQRGRDVNGTRPTVTTAYNADGQPETITDSSNGSTSVSYFLDGLVRDVTSRGRVTKYAYNAAGARTAHTNQEVGSSANSARTLYTYNHAGLPESMSEQGLVWGQWFWTYFADGRINTETDPSGIQRLHQYNADGTLAQLTMETEESAPRGSYSYTYDELYRQLTQTVSGTGSTGQGQATVGYDPAGRIKRYTPPGGTGKDVTWDSDGNRTSYGSAQFEYNVDGSIRRSKDEGSTVWRDHAYAGFGGLSGDECTTYAYDGFDRLSTVRSGNGSGCAPVKPVDYTYDSLDRQATRTINPGTPNAKHEDQHYDGLGNTVVRDGDSNNVAYVLGPLGEPRAAGLLDVGWEPHMLESDGAGSIVGAFDAFGERVCTARFDPFGTPQAPQQNADHACHTGATHNEVFYRGGQRDSATGNYQFGARTYSPSRGGFMTPDSFRDAQPVADLAVGTDPLTMNRYSYVNGDPVNLVDPTGHWPSCFKICGVASAVMQAGADLGSAIVDGAQAAVSTVSDAITTVVDTAVAVKDAVVSGGRWAADNIYDQVREMRSFVSAKGRAAFDATKKVVRTVTKTTASVVSTVGNGIAAAGRAVVNGVKYCLGDGARTCATVASAIALAATGVGAIAGSALLAGSAFTATASTFSAIATATTLASGTFSLVSFARTGDTGDLVAAALAFAGPMAKGARALRSTVGSRSLASAITAADSADGGVDLVLKMKRGWNAAQRADAIRKVDALSEGRTVVTSVGRRTTSASRIYARNGGALQKGKDIDHIIDLQLGGADDFKNMWLLDRSVNRSLGAQIARRIKSMDLAEGTVINKFLLVG